MRRIILMCYVLCLFNGFASARISGSACKCTNAIVDCSSRSKSQIYPGEMCSNVTIANFEQNNLSDYPDNLKTFLLLNIASNLLTRLPNFNQLNPNILVLNLSQNMIANETNELRLFASLNKLYVSNNRLKSLSFLPEPCFLEVFSAENNFITDVQGPLKLCTRMSQLDLDGNQLTRIPPNLFAGMSQLTILSLNNNPLITLSDDVLRGPLNLRNLYMSDINITTLPNRLFSGTPKLKILYLNRNRLYEFPNRQLRDLADLEELRIWKNRIRELPTLRNCCPKLQEVVIDFNNLTEPSEEAVLSFLRRNTTTLSLLRNPLRPTALRWALSSANLLPFVREDNCACGGLRRSDNAVGDGDGGGNIAVVWCLSVRCGPSTPHLDWVAAVNASFGA